MSALDSSPYTPFTCALVPNREEVAVVAAGDLDLATTGQLEREVRELETAGFERIVLDLRRVAFIDSSGLRTLLALRNDAKRNGHSLTLVAPAVGVCRIFELTGTRALFDWRPSFPA